MKLTLAACLLFLAINAHGQDVSATQRPNTKSRTVRAAVPHGMAYIPSGTMVMQEGSGPATRTIQMLGFYMDKNEVSNQEYRQFVTWVRDSIANDLLGNHKTMADGSQRLDMKRIDWQDAAVQAKLAPIYRSGAPAGKSDVNPATLVYHYKWFDYRNSMVPHPNEKTVIKYVHSENVPVYPDTTVWSRNGGANYNDPIAAQYFWFHGFNYYPAVGVSVPQCLAFCNWRTVLWKEEKRNEGELTEANFRLPTEEESELAAKGGSNDVVVHTQIPFLAKPDAGGFIANASASSSENKYGLRKLGGVVSEWTATAAGGAGDPADALFKDNSNKWVDVATSPAADKHMQIVRGSNWMNEASGQNIGNRFAYPKDSSAAYIGFRCVFTQVLTGK